MQAWVAAQNSRTRTVLDGLPQRAPLHRRFLELLQAGSVAAPQVAGDRVFTLERYGPLDQAVVVVRSATDDALPARIVVDPHDRAADHAAAVDWFSPSPDGRLLAYGISEGGSEHGVLRVADVATGQLLPDAIAPVRHPSPAWLPDGSAFAYSRLPDPTAVPAGEEGYWEQLFWHRMGDDQADDELVLGGSDLDRTALPMASISPDGRWLVIHIHLMPTRTDVIVLDRATGARTVAVAGEEAWTWATVVDGAFYAHTSVDAPRGRIVAAPAETPQRETWTTVVPEGEGVIEGMAIAGTSLLVATAEHAASRLWRYERAGGGPAEEIGLPEVGSIGGIDADPATDRAFLTFTSFTTPPRLLRWAARPPAGLAAWSRHPSPVDPAAFRTEQVFYCAADGTRIPMFLVSRAGAEPSAATPTVLSGYGGFAVTSTPAYSPGVVAWCEAGGAYAVAGIRGGGEYGEDWHRAGMLHGKQTVFDDFAAAARWLVADGRTSPQRLAVRGGSNGGLLVGATMVQHPDLCRAAVCAVPLLDMLRYHRFLIGALWVPEYGDPDDPADFAALRAYSPYHHVVDGRRYPAVLLLTAESDSRVDPMHARKFAARLQAADPEGGPVLLRVEGRAGHGAGKPRWKQADELADTWAFLSWQLGACPS